MESAWPLDSACPDEALWHAYMCDMLPVAVRDHLSRHVAMCRNCFRVLAAQVTLAMRIENPGRPRSRPTSARRARIAPGDPEYALLTILRRRRNGDRRSASE